jgi:hypothetical protein
MPYRAAKETICSMRALKKTSAVSRITFASVKSIQGGLIGG